MLNSKFMIGECDGALYDTTKENWSANPLRENYARHYREINNTTQLKATLRAGEYTFPGLYRLAFITNDGVWISFNSVRDNLYCVVDSIRNDINDGWRVVGCDIMDYYDEEEIYCAHSSELLNGEIEE